MTTFEAPTIRIADSRDAGSINEIYNHYVLHSTCTFQEAPDSLETRQSWLAAHGEAHPVTVAVADDVVVGWASASPYRSRTGYRYTVEHAVYIREGFHRRGYGRALMVDLIARCRTAGHHVMIATIAADQSASVALHRGLGFVDVAHLREVGFKFGRWLDTVYLQLMLKP